MAMDGRNLYAWHVHQESDEFTRIPVDRYILNCMRLCK